MSDFEIISKLFSEEDKADIKGYLIYLLKSEMKEAFDDGWVFPVDRFKDFMDELLEDVEQEIKDEYKNEIKKGFEQGMMKALQRREDENRSNI